MTERRTSLGQRHPNHKPGLAGEYRAWSVGSRAYYDHILNPNAGWRPEYADHPLGARLGQLGIPLVRFRDLLAVKCGRLYTMDEVKSWVRKKRQASGPDPEHYEDMAEVLQTTVVEVSTWWTNKP